MTGWQRNTALFITGAAGIILYIIESSHPELPSQFADNKKQIGDIFFTALIFGTGLGRDIGTRLNHILGTIRMPSSAMVSAPNALGNYTQNYSTNSSRCLKNKQDVFFYASRPSQTFPSPAISRN